MRAGEDEVDELRPRKVGDAVADQNAEIVVPRVAADDRRLAHAAIVCACVVARMRPDDADALAGEVARVAENPFARDRIRRKQRVDEKVDPSARDEKLDAALPAKLEQLGKSGADARGAEHELRDFVFHGRGQQFEQAADAFADADFAGADPLDERLPARRVEMPHDRDDVVA